MARNPVCLADNGPGPFCIYGSCCVCTATAKRCCVCP